MVKITVYSTPTCPYCTAAKDFLAKKEVEFSEVDVSEDQKKAEEMVKKSGQMGVPVIVIEKEGKEEVLIGFDEGKITELLELDK